MGSIGNLVIWSCNQHAESVIGSAEHAGNDMIVLWLAKDKLGLMPAFSN
jgi:hypothetical protein